MRGGSRTSGYRRGLVAYAYPGDVAGEGDTITIYISSGPKARKPKGNRDNGPGNGDNGGDGNNGRGNG